MAIGPYLLYSSVSLFLGGISYKILTKNDNVDVDLEKKKIEIDTDYNLVKDDLTETLIDIDKKSLGRNLDEKMDNIKKICKDECGIDNNIKNSSKLRQRLKRYIKEYENIGHKKFVKNHKKSNFNSMNNC